MSEQSKSKKMRNDNNNKNKNNHSNEGSGNSSTTTNSCGKRGKNKSSGSTSNTTTNNPNNLERPKQPQRGLGVAQLEKIRMHSQMANVGIFPHHQIPHPAYVNPPFQHMPDEMRFQVGYQVTAPPQPQPQPFCCSTPPVSSSSFGYQSYHHPNAYMMNMGDHMERTTNMRYSESQPFNTPRWNPSSSFRGMPETQPYTEPQGMVTRHLLSHVEQQNYGASNVLEPDSPTYPHFDSSEMPELDLELRL